MIYQITQGIRISVITNFKGVYFKNYRINYAFTFRITIENQSKDAVQLLGQHWEIFDALKNKEFIDAEGIDREKPIIKSGQNYTYNSSCLLRAPFGAIKGYFKMINFTTTQKFRVIIPVFRLEAIHALN